MTTQTHARSYLDDVPPELHRVLANPESDEERLIFADWLDDHDEEERADLIRWMVKQGSVRARFVHQPSSTDDHYLRCWSDHSLEGNPHREHYPEKPGSWACAMRIAMVGTADIPDDPPFGIEEGFGLIFRRGFVAEVHAPLAVLLEHLPAIVRQHPIERVRATDKEPYRYEGVEHLWPEHWTWWKNGSNLDSADVSEDVFALLIADMQPYGEDGDGKNFSSPEAAHGSLSDALLTLARR